jgi:seryl-tRNA synthetase
MLDINMIREKPGYVKEGLSRKGFNVDFTEFLEKDKSRRELIRTTENLKAEKNKISSEIPALKKQGTDLTSVFARIKEDSELIKLNDQRIADLDQEMSGFLESLPNLPDDDVLSGGKENNAVIRTFGNVPEFSYEPKHHVDIAESLGIIDYTRGVKLGGNGFWIYKGLGARLEWAILNYFIEEHLNDGYEMLLVPHILNYACGYTAVNSRSLKKMYFNLRATMNQALLILYCQQLRQHL